MKDKKLFAPNDNSVARTPEKESDNGKNEMAETVIIRLLFHKTYSSNLIRARIVREHKLQNACVEASRRSAPVMNVPFREQKADGKCAFIYKWR